METIKEWHGHAPREAYTFSKNFEYRGRKVRMFAKTEDGMATLEIHTHIDGQRFHFGIIEPKTQTNFCYTDELLQLELEIKSHIAQNDSDLKKRLGQVINEAKDREYKVEKITYPPKGELTRETI